jgi:D-tyrosyl-tRNA(Tyr) deacylase
MYEDFTNSLAQFTQKNIQNGIFGADMQIELLNDGPVTILLDSRDKG